MSSSSSDVKVEPTREVAKEGEYVLIQDLENDTRIQQLLPSAKLRIGKYPQIWWKNLIGQPYGVTMRYNWLSETWERKQRFVLGYGDLVIPEWDDEDDDDKAGDDRDGEDAGDKGDERRTNKNITQDDTAQALGWNEI